MKPDMRYRLIIILVAKLVLMLLWAVTVSAQPPVPHPEEENGISYEDCVACHRTGDEDAPLLAADHVRHENADCRTCHGTTGMAAPAITHPAGGWADCRGCHEEWTGEDVPNLADSGYDHAPYHTGTCQSCHSVEHRFYEGMPVVACGVCHPKSTAAETVHNNPETWVDCVACHEAAGRYPHDEELIYSRDEDCLACHHDLTERVASSTPGLVSTQPDDRRYSLADHIGRGAPHAVVDCVACHLEQTTVVRDPTTHRVKAVLPEVEEGVAPDTPELAEITKDVDCARCHQRPAQVPAPSTRLPPRSVLCLACHDASPVVKDAFSWAGLGFFGVGMLLVGSFWLRGSIAGRRSAPLGQRIGRLLYNVWDFVVSPRVFRFLWAFLMDGLLHRQVWRESRRRWLTHALMFMAFLARALLGIVTWVLASIAPTAALTQALVDKNNPGVAFAYDFLAVLVILGAILALYRRFIVRDPQLITSGQDTVVIALLGSIFLMGFVVEGARIVTTDLRLGLAIYSFGGHLVALLMRPLPVAWDVVYGYLWYIHAALVATLAAYLPFSKFLHVLISPLVAAINSASKHATAAEYIEHH
jgi:nitrate reductase gamma subunit